MHATRYKKGDEVKILELFKVAFKKNLSSDFWNWRFKCNPMGNELMINLMWDDELLAGHYAVSAIELLIEGATIKASLSGTTMTHPNYEGRGIFSALAKTLYERIFSELDIALVYGFPNNKSHYSLVKNINWQDLGIITNFSRKYIANQKKNILYKYEIVALNEFNEDHEKFILNNINEFGFSIAVKRSTKYLNWRYLNCPINRYYCFEINNEDKLCGIVIFKIYEVNGVNAKVDIVEFFCSSHLEIINQILDLIVDFLTKMGFSEITFNIWISLFDPRHLLFEKLNFVLSEPLTYMCVKQFSHEFSGIYNMKNWYISMGDSDVY